MTLPLSARSGTTAYLNVDGLRLRYKAAGTGEQVLLLHGWGGSIESMGVVFDDFAKDYAVVALDFPGHGESNRPPQAWGVADFATCVLRCMDMLQLQRPHIIAHSHGGRVTIQLASSAPERIAKVVLVNSAGVPAPRSWRYYARVAMAKLGTYLARYCGQVGERARQAIYRAVASPDYAHAGPLRETFVKLVNADLTPLLSRITSPTLLVWGEDDHDTPVACARVMERLIPTAELVILKHAGHFSYLDQYGKFRLIVRRFLRQ